VSSFLPMVALLHGGTPMRHTGNARAVVQPCLSICPSQQTDCLSPYTTFYPHTLYANPLYPQGGCRLEPCPVAEACIADAFWPPQRVLMGDGETTSEAASAIRPAVARQGS